MLDVTYSSKFKRLQNLYKTSLQMDLLQQAIDTLRVPETSRKKQRPHAFREFFLIS